MDPPLEDEVEITLLGRGVGESVVVHLLGGKWMIVDSCLHGKKPAAQWYLDELDVNPDDVEIIVVTHFHSDHYRGIDRLHTYYSRARLMITEALREDQFRAIQHDEGEPAILGRLPLTIRRAEERRIGSLTSGLRGLKAGQEIFANAKVMVKAVSPSDSAVNLSNAELGHALQAGLDSDAIRSRLADDNRCSVAMRLDIDGIRVLLGSDLICDPAAYGWKAVLDDPNHQHLRPSSLVKVPHHGGISAHDEGMWDRLVEMGSVILVAPYWPSAIPTDEDIARLSAYGTVWQATRSTGYDIDDDGIRTNVKREIGIVQARRRSQDPEWRVVCLEPAFRAATHNPTP
jgi:beta-lactamase superfamily II metal-dependent hydrolase